MSRGGADTADDAELERLIHAVDLDGLVRMVDQRCTVDDWRGLLRLRDRCRAATRESGRQLWPAATLAEYRAALQAPAEWAASVLDGEAGRFTIGPLSEVAAVNHTWDELVGHLDPVPVAVYFAHERAIRGEPVDDLADFPGVLDIPARLQRWEPEYPISTYTDAGAEHPEPRRTPPSELIDLSAGAEQLDDDATELAVRHLLEPWSSSSSGRVESVAVDGDATAAIAALGVRRARIVEISTGEAVAQLAWAGASGAAHGRRRGMANGRFSTWWLLAALGDLHDEWPPSQAAIEDLLGELRWYAWDAHEPATGWQLQIAVEDPSERVAWAINATDNE